MKMKKVNEVVEEVIRRMVKNSGKGIFKGSPREFMEDIAVSSGPLYHSLYQRGFVRRGRGQNATWTIPKKYLERYGK